ncbi:hypothetical protein J6590_012475 [Homalodisca vitripennis]|nr:hypothetical protein J6590_012475 [Homalodisca vitripennis]
MTDKSDHKALGSKQAAILKIPISEVVWTWSLIDCGETPPCIAFRRVVIASQCFQAGSHRLVVFSGGETPPSSAFSRRDIASQCYQAERHRLSMLSGKETSPRIGLWWMTLACNRCKNSQIGTDN